MREQPFGRRRSERTGEWVELGGRYERFESQPPTDHNGQHAEISFKGRVALRAIEGVIGSLSTSRQTQPNSGRRTRTTLPTLDQYRYDKWWRNQVTTILNKNQAAEASAQVIDLKPNTGERRAA